jgi:pimeloyl-ACP methyl ester carboxylesterase
MNYVNYARIEITCILCFFCVSCTPAWLDYDNTARSLQFNRHTINTKKFTIIVYSNESFNTSHSKQIHVYFDGDGSPWHRNGLSINDDPTPRQHLVLRLMSLDIAPSILIGRPCYHGLSHDDSNCHPLLWTHERYSEEVVSTMSEALNTVLKNAGEPEAILIGYSGGGALAQLLGERIQKTRAAITLAGNLDSAAWAQLHGYSPLDGSFNPAERPPLPSHILQIHYVGHSDNNIPAHLVNSYVSKKNRGEIIILDQADHYNGWLEHWPSILIDLNKRLTTQ